jgi:hypothetical protein
MRYTIVEETEKQGRKKFTQWAVFDNLEGRVIVRYADRKQAEDLLQKYLDIIKEK